MPSRSAPRFGAAARRSAVLVLVLGGLGLLVSGCGRSGPGPIGSGAAGKGRFLVVAAENFWGSLAAQLAGDRAEVRSIIVSPATDPHSYQPSTGDARLLAASNMAIVNGLGYDEWASQLLHASADSNRVVLNVGDSLGLSEGSNPHRWYYPGNVLRVVNAIVAGYDRLEPAEAGYFAARRRWLLGSAFARYDQLLGEIRARYRGVPVGYSESIFQGLGEYTGLELATPASFARAVAEGADVTAQDKRTVDAQAAQRKIAVWVFNSQNVTPDVQRVNQIVHREGIPLVEVTETLSPAGDSFEAWQTAELEALLGALALSRR